MLEDGEVYARSQDREQCKAKFRRREMEDLDRRIHERRFSATEEEWPNNNSFYHKQFQVGCSSSTPSSSLSSFTSSECFRVYVKGLVSDE